MATPALTSPPPAIDLAPLQPSEPIPEPASSIVLSDAPVQIQVAESPPSAQTPSPNSPAPSSLRIQVSIEVNHLLTLLGTLDTPSLRKITHALTTVLEQRAAQASAVHLQDTLAQKTVPELKALAQELGLSLRSRLKKAEIIAAIVTAQPQANAPPAPNPTPPPSPQWAQQLATPDRDNRAIWEQLFAEVDALEYSPPNADALEDPLLQKFRRQGLNIYDGETI